MQKKAPLRPNWQASFDAHLYAGRMMELVVMQRPEEKKVSEIRVSVQSLADHCKTTDDIASVWVRTSIIIIIFFLTPVLNSRGKKKLRYAIKYYYYYYYIVSCKGTNVVFGL